MALGVESTSAMQARKPPDLGQRHSSATLRQERVNSSISTRGLGIPSLLLKVLRAHTVEELPEGLNLIFFLVGNVNPGLL